MTWYAFNTLFLIQVSLFFDNRMQGVRLTWTFLAQPVYASADSTGDLLRLRLRRGTGGLWSGHL